MPFSFSVCIGINFRNFFLFSDSRYTICNSSRMDRCEGWVSMDQTRVTGMLWHSFHGLTRITIELSNKVSAAKWEWDEKKTQHRQRHTTPSTLYDHFFASFHLPKSQKHKSVNDFTRYLRIITISRFSLLITVPYSMFMCVTIYTHTHKSSIFVERRADVTSYHTV